MAEYLIQGESLTGIADEIRELSGTNDTMGLDAMKAHIGEANDEIVTQADLIEQIANALEDKAGGSKGSLDICNVTINSFDYIYSISYTAYENGNIITKFLNSDNKSFVLSNVICGSAITFYNAYDFNGFTHSHNSKFVGNYAMYIWVLSAPTTPNVNATITIFDDD